MPQSTVPHRHLPVHHCQCLSDERLRWLPGDFVRPVLFVEVLVRTHDLFQVGYQEEACGQVFCADIRKGSYVVYSGVNMTQGRVFDVV